MSIAGFRGAIALVSLASLLAAAPPPPHSPRVSNFSAYLLNSRTGRLSNDIMTRTDELGNVPAGPLSAVSMLVVVRVDFGLEAAIPQGLKVRLVATEPSKRGVGRVLLDRASKLGPVAADGTSHVGFWIDDTGCAPVKLRATLMLGAAPSKAAGGETLVPFNCYE